MGREREGEGGEGKEWRVASPNWMSLDPPVDD